MSPSERLIRIAHDMYEGYGASSVSGIAHFRKYEAELREYSYLDVVEHLMGAYPNRYVVDFLLSTPFLWRGLPGAMWADFLMRKNARPSPLKAVDHVAMFADVEFLNRYVGVDALGFLVESESVDGDDKRNMLAYFRRFPDSLARSDLDLDDLDGDYFVASSELSVLAEALCRDFGFERFDIDIEGISSYLEELIRK